MTKRFENPCQARYLTFSCYNRIRLFVTDDLCNLFTNHLENKRTNKGFELYAFVMMPNHVHLLLKPAYHDSVSKILLSLKKTYSYKALKLLQESNSVLHDRLIVKEGGKNVRRFWQAGGGYDRNIYKAESLKKAIDYIHMNPVRKGLVKNPVDWKWSSARFWIKDEDDPLRMDIPEML